MPINKVETGRKILESLLDYCVTFQHILGGRSIKYSRYVIKLHMNPLDLAELYERKYTFRFDQSLYGRGTNFHRARIEARLKTLSHRYMYVGFRGKLDFYKDFSMYYVFNVGDDNVYRLRTIQESQGHNEVFPYWSTVYGLPLTEDKIYTMLYDAMNKAFNWKDDEMKINKLFSSINLATIREV